MCQIDVDVLYWTMIEDRKTFLDKILQNKNKKVLHDIYPMFKNISSNIKGRWCNSVFDMKYWVGLCSGRICKKLSLTF